ncbi:Clan MG, family M24, aminopeptidase P-like metallopeptidase [Tritrichomonas foetus]|uniref:Clan MG, family M24, aminopeptidase P-like metallopeptidase n=1 Tax=Tritrichomonas foetus TaxID=1144522 RepID=A0A1J4JMK0_9EUKA|nr:Clan MG, family M24, aminopeptidase P-like metallopeptidase [Tritrichomonas foetus]|eukprot:OHT00299.1 Clan MG, family M24, aminopeptidase P-like metallopeptidase [Tritrichomonas foetus]
MPLDRDNRPVPKPELFAYNRAQVLKRMQAAKAEGAILMFGFPEPGRPLTDYDPKFRQESYFWYMTGVNEPECACYIDIKSGHSVLFYPLVPEDMVIWAGEQPTLEQIRVNYGFDEILLNTEIANYVDKQKPAALHTAVESLVHGDFKVVSDLLLDAIGEQRQIKSEGEIELMRYSAGINNEAYRRVLRTLKPNQYEYEVESELQHEYCGYYCMYPPFQCTVCSGPLCAILHYHKKTRKIMDGDLVLIDAGGEYEMYCADNTRTFPANGKYNDDQKLIYTAVLEAQKAVISAAKPGVHWKDMAILSARVMAENLVKAGLLVGTVDEIMQNEVMTVFYPHGLGHGMGLDVHEVLGWPKGVEHPRTAHIAPLRMGRVLEPGIVCTVEPGCYFIPSLFNKAFEDPNKAKHINKEVCLRMQKTVGGVRIEDDILITKDGCENLSAQIPKEIDEIEALMAAAK